jgi:hypothetical protein
MASAPCFIVQDHRQLAGNLPSMLMPAAAQIILVWSVYYSQDPVSQTMQIGGLARVGQEQYESRTVILSLGGCPSGSPIICLLALSRF